MHVNISVHASFKNHFTKDKVNDRNFWTLRNKFACEFCRKLIQNIHNVKDMLRKKKILYIDIKAKSLIFKLQIKPKCLYSNCKNFDSQIYFYLSVISYQFGPMVQYLQTCITFFHFESRLQDFIFLYNIENIKHFVTFRRYVKVPDESDKWWMEEDSKNASDDDDNVDLDEDIDNSAYKVNGG